MNYKDIGSSLFDFILVLGRGIGEVWNWLNNPIVIGRISFFGFKIFDGFTFTPIQLSGGVIIALVVMGIIKTFVPVA